MQIGDSVTFQGRRYVVVGFTPFSVRPSRVELRDPDTNEHRWVSWPRPENVVKAALRRADSG